MSEVTKLYRYFAAVVMAMALCATSQEPGAASVVHVDKTFDGHPFEYTVSPLREAAKYSVVSLSYPSPVQSPVTENNTVPAELYLPKGVQAGATPRPAVICLHILNGDFSLVRLLCSALADSGVPAMMFKLPYYGERSPPGARKKMLADPAMLGETIQQGLQDARRAVDILSARPDIDGSRIGISGISLGAVVGATACGVEPRFWRGCFVLGGADVLAILEHARETRQLRNAMTRLSPDQRGAIQHVLREIDPMAYPERLGQMGNNGRIMMINAAEDEVIPRACTEKLASISGISDKVVWLPGLGHYTAMAALPRIITQTVQFFGEDLPDDAQGGVSAPVSTTPFQALVGFVGQIGTFLGMPPGEGGCHYVDLTVSFSRGSEKNKKFDLTVIRGASGRFVFRGDVPEVGEMELGFCDYPWMSTKDGSIFVGTQPEDQPVIPGQYIDAKALLQLRVVAGAMMGISLAPSAFENYADVEEHATDQGRRLDFKLKHPGLKGYGSLLIDSASGTPKYLTFEKGGMKLDVDIKQWHINTVATTELFQEPEGRTQKQVPAEDLCRMFAAALGFAAEKVQ